jgi:hypothetical protein
MKSQIKVACLILIGICLTAIASPTLVVHAGPLDELQSQLLAPSTSAAGTADIVQPAVTPAFNKFSAVGNLTATLSDKECPGLSFLHPYCSSHTCSQLNISGTTTATAPSAKPKLTACITIAETAFDPAGVCDVAAGSGTLEAASGALVNLNLSGTYCESVVHLAAPVFVDLVLNGTWTAVGGTGPYSTATGSGNYGISFEVTSLLAPVTGAALTSFVGGLAK